MTAYLVTDWIGGVSWCYSSITAAVLHFENPLELTDRRWRQIVSEKGYPFDHSGCRIQKIHIWTTPEVREDNPPTFQD